MAASIETVREKMKVSRTRDDKGLTLTLDITAYDNGVISVDGRPVSTVPLDAAHGWLSCHEVVSIALTEFYRQHQKRLKA